MYLSKVSDLEENLILAKNICGAKGELLLGKGTVLNKKYINKLKSFGIEQVYIKEKEAPTLSIDNEVSREKEKAKLIPEKIRREAIIIASGSMKKMTLGRDMSQTESKKEMVDIMGIIEEIIDKISGSEELLFNLKDMRMLEDELFFHLTNVTVLSLIVGKKLGYSKSRLRILGIGAFLHDIGKVMIDPKILNKPGKLTVEEFEEVKKHTVYGYKILRKFDNIPNAAARIAYQHHERCDGSGYPKGITKRFIDEYSRIVGIADVFDAMVNDRVYREGINVKDVIEYLYTTFTENQMDRDMLQKFLEMLTPYPIGTKVRLNIGCEAVVVEINEEAKQRPIVKVISFDGLDKNIEFDLSKELNIDIIDVIG